ncbi:MAG: Plasmid stabilization system protein [Bradyrhizobium sp.]|nr:Plasmid stabilization system protein [Bradyrhizobium sp.]
MTNKFRKRSQADADLDSIWSYIAADNITAADDLIARIGTVFEMLLRNPMAGRERPELLPRLRSFAVANYTIFYFANLDGVEIVRIMSGRQDIDAEDMR